MTVAPQVERLTFRDLPGAVKALRERGLRVSTARRLVLGALFADKDPVSAEDLARRLGVELTSVYRNLETLERHGLVHHVHLGHGPGLYTLVGHGDREYLHCERCGAVRVMDPQQLEPVRSQIETLSGYRARFSHFPIVGICGVCARRESATARAHEH